MKTAYELFNEAIERWRNNKGTGTALIPAPLNDKLMILGVLQRIYERSPTTTTLIVTNDFSQRAELIEFLTHQDDEDNNAEFKNLIAIFRLRVLTKKYIIDSNRPITGVRLVILYRPDNIDSYAVNYILSAGHYKLVILNKLLPIEDRNYLYNVCPLLEEFKQNELNELRTSTPVEETLIKVSVSDTKFLDYYNEYISTSISIFGSLDIIKQARVGNEQLNISASQICANIAEENGWNDKLDMSIEYNRKVDELYNPINLRERATKTYEIIRLRSNLLSDEYTKCDEVLKLVKQYPHDRFLIINKRGDFAKIVTDYINSHFDYETCGNYHDRVDNIPATKLDGTPIFIKSGANAGERKLFGAQAQMTFNEKRLNNKIITCLSTNNAPNKDLCCKIDRVIITSPQCEDIETYFYRLANVTFSNPLQLYILYCENTLEEKQIINRTIPKNHKIINEIKNNVTYEENNDFVIVD